MNRWLFVTVKSTAEFQSSSTKRKESDHERYVDGDRNPYRCRRYERQLHNAHEICPQMGLGEHVVSLDASRARSSAFFSRLDPHPQSIHGLSFSYAGHNSRSLWIWCGLGSSAGLFRPCGGHDWDYARILYRLRNVRGCRQPDPDDFAASRPPQQPTRVCSSWCNYFGPLGRHTLCHRRKETRGTEYAVYFIAKTDIA